MKAIVTISRIIVGVLFIISGLIKLNDPVGFSFKLDEYFGTTVLDLPSLAPYALMIAVVVVVFEVLLGVFLLIGYKPKFTVWSLLAMIVFFTFLTFYSAYFNKVTDCGCFGDAIKLTPWESFTKDVILLVLIVILLLGLKYIKPIFNRLGLTVVSLLSFIACLSFGYYVLMHLPAKDFRPYKIGKNITAQMIVPEDAPKAILDYYWKFNVNGVEEIIKTQGSYPTVEGEFIGVETEEVQAGYEPPIHDFSIERDGEDFTEVILNEDNVVMIIMYDLVKSESEGLTALKSISDEALRNGYKVVGITASNLELQNEIKNAYGLNFDFYFCDETALKTIVRSNPGILKLKKGTIIQKLHWNDITDLELETLPNANMELNLDLKRQLDSVMVLDQKYRADYSHETWKLQEAIDSSNTAFIETVFEKHGYPGKSMVGEPSNEAAYYVIQHSNKITKYLDLIKGASEKGELDKTLVAMMEDRHLMYQGKKQIYGTQGSSYGIGSNNPISFIWPIEDLDNVNQRRQDVGFTTTLEVYSKRLFGDDFVFKNYTLKEVEKIKNSAFNH